MTITYANGTVLEAIVLSHEENEIRAIAAGCDDVLGFNCIHGTWISDELEPVNIKFGWQRGVALTPELADCICSKELATHLIQTLLTGCQPVAQASDTLYVFSSAGDRVAINFSDLQLH
jgi:hypothetical protein